MARSFLVLALTSLVPATLAFADPTPVPAPPAVPVPPPQDGARPKKDRGSRDTDSGRHPSSDEDGPFGRFKKHLEQMSPEEREHFQENLKRWKQMGDGEKQNWQQRAMDERARMKKIIDDTIEKLGLKLDEDQREVFVLRYRQERRKIEEQLCSEMNAKRDREVADMLQRLKSEFSTPKPTPAPEAAKPAPTP